MMGVFVLSVVVLGGDVLGIIFGFFIVCEGYFDGVEVWIVEIMFECKS